jgi:hypothetical protein
MPYGARTGGLEDHRGGRRVGTGEVGHARRKPEGHRHEHRQVAHGTRRKHGAAGLGDVGHRLDDDRVGFLGSERRDLLGERLEDVVEGGRAERLEHEPGRTHVGKHVLRAGLARHAHRGTVELLDLVAEPVLVELGREPPNEFVVTQSAPAST